MADTEEYGLLEDSTNQGEVVDGMDGGDATEDALFAEEPLSGIIDASNDAPGGEEAAEDPELEAIKARVREMEEEAEKLKEMQSEVDKQMNISTTSTASSTTLNQSLEEKVEADARSVYVGNVDYGATAEELEAHFHGCGGINRVTIQCDKFSGHPKGFAYIEFADKDSVTTSQALDESLFRGRQIKVIPKRTNRPGITSTNRPPRGRGRGRARFSTYRGAFRGYSRRPRRSSWFTPY